VAAAALIMGELPVEDAEREFDELLAFMCFTSEKFWGFGPEHELNPAKVSQAAVEKFGKAKVLVGLRQAVNGHLDDFQDFSPAQVAELDQELRARGIVTLTQLRWRHSSQFATIRARGSIDNESEYYLVKGVLEELGPMLLDEEREMLADMARRFGKDKD
jgi:hypothetical protein